MRKSIVEKSNKKIRKNEKKFFNLKVKVLLISLACLLLVSCAAVLFFSKENALLKQQNAKDGEVMAMQSEIINKTSDLNQEKDAKIKKIGTYLSEIDKFATKVASFLKISKPSSTAVPSSSNNLEEKPVSRAYVASRSSEGNTSRSSVNSIPNVDSLISKSQQLTSTLKKVEGVASNYEILKNGIPSIWPLQGIITSNFGTREDPVTLNCIEMHEGIDITAYYGAPIRAAASGVVVQSGINGTYGISCTINHENGYQTLYGHMSRIVVVVNDRVVKGQIIGYEGNTGKTTGPHLHYEVILNGVAVNPLKFLP